jgi:hypothetical protein
MDSRSWRAEYKQNEYWQIKNNAVMQRSWVMKVKEYSMAPIPFYIFHI